MRHGTVVSVKGTASGRLFAAFMPRDQMLAVLRAETGRERAQLGAEFEAELVAVRQQRFASLIDGTVRGVTAIAAPVFDGFGSMVLSLTAIGPSATLDASPKGQAAQLLKDCAASLSSQLGARPQGGSKT
jgi:DNA-binding IclR family transcriptional regulator